MGRSDLQGSPWHYEYAQGTGKNNSKNCAFNIGYCSCTASLFHGQECVGKLECEDFERGNAQGPKPKKQNPEKQKQNPEKNKRIKKAKKTLKGGNSQDRKRKEPQPKEQQKPIHLKRAEKPLPKDSIKVGDSITVQDLNTREIFDLTISDPQNQFVGKILSQSVEINQVYYKVVRINDRQVDRELK